MKQKTTQVELPTLHQMTLKVIEKAVYQATKRIKEGSAILPEQQDQFLAHDAVFELLDQNEHLKNDGANLMNVYMFTLAQVTSAMITVFDDVTSDSY